jgi:hypothetical protein
MTRHDFDDLAAELKIPDAAAREQRLYAARGGPRRKNTGPADPVKLGLDAQILATFYRYRLGMTCQLLASIFAIDLSRISIATRHIADLLSRHGTIITPARTPIRTPDALTAAAEAAGIALPPGLTARLTGQPPAQPLPQSGHATRRTLTLLNDAYSPGCCPHTCFMRQAFAQEAVLVMELDADVRAPGAAVTVALCGHWDHEPPCPLAPHHVRVDEDDGELRVRILFAAEPCTEAEVRHLIE